MDEEGTRYIAEVRGSECVIEQTEQGNFELSVSGKSKGKFSSAKEAREKIISVISDQLVIDEADARVQVPQLSLWKIERSAPFDPENRS